MLSSKMKIKIVEYFDKTTSKLNEIGSSRSNAATSCQSKQPSEDIERMSIESFSCEIGEFLFNVDSSAGKRNEKNYAYRNYAKQRSHFLMSNSLFSSPSLFLSFSFSLFLIHIFSRDHLWFSSDDQKCKSYNLF